MTKFTLPKDTNIVFRYVLLVYSVIFAGQPLFTNLNLLHVLSEDRGGIPSLNRVRRTSVILNDRTFYLINIPL